MSVKQAVNDPHDSATHHKYRQQYNRRFHFSYLVCCKGSAFLQFLNRYAAGFRPQALIFLRRPKPHSTACFAFLC